MTEPITRTDVRTSIAEKLRGNDLTAGIARPKEQPETPAATNEQPAQAGEKEATK